MTTPAARVIRDATVALAREGTDDDGCVTAGQRESARLRLEPVGPHSHALLHALHQDPGIAAWYGGRWTQEQARAWAAAMAEHWAQHGLGKWLATDRADGTLVGRGGLSRVTLLGRPRIEVGWSVRQALWGRGYATEIGREALAVAFQEHGADEVVAFTEVHNVSSRRVMERLGMHYTGEIRRPGLVAGSTQVQADAPFALYRITR